MPCRARRVTTASAKASRATAPVVCIAPRAGYAFPRLSGTRLSSAPRAYGVVSRSTRAQRARCLRVEARVRRARAGPDEGFRGPPRLSHRGTIHPFRGSLGHLEPQKTRLFLRTGDGFESLLLQHPLRHDTETSCLPLLAALGAVGRPLRVRRRRWIDGTRCSLDHVVQTTPQRARVSTIGLESLLIF